MVTGCAGECQYCYLHTTLGTQPYLRLYVNTEEILDAAGKHLTRRLPAVTAFEGSATSDPLTVEHYSGSLKQTILYFSRQEKGVFRFATKQVTVDSLLELDHRGKTRARFSLNAARVSQQYEKGVPPPQRRIAAALKMKKAGYPVGFLIAPVFIFPGWKDEYRALLEKLAETWQDEKKESAGPAFEIIAHRFTSRAKKRIREIFPDSTLPLNEKERKFKYGQFGYGKYIYPPDIYAEIRELFTESIATLFPSGRLDYIV